MKISIVTPAFNAGAHLVDCARSIQQQTHTDWQHHIIDGGSEDGTRELVASLADPRLRFLSEPDKGIYDAMNKGIARADGEVIGILNADDCYAGPEVLKSVAKVFEDEAVDGCYSDLAFVSATDSQRVVRFWKSEPFKRGAFLRGWMLPHPTLFLRREVYERYGVFDTQFRIGGDWDFLLRIFEKEMITSCYVPETWVRMRVGGASTGSVRGIVKNNLENLRAFRKNGLRPRWYYLPYRFCHRFGQLHFRDPGPERAAHRK